MLSDKVVQRISFPVTKVYLWKQGHRFEVFQNTLQMEENTNTCTALNTHSATTFQVHLQKFQKEDWSDFQGFKNCCFSGIIMHNHLSDVMKLVRKSENIGSSEVRGECLDW